MYQNKQSLVINYTGFNKISHNFSFVHDKIYL